MVNEWTFAEWMMFLPGKQAMPGFDNSERPFVHDGEECVHMMDGELLIYIDGRSTTWRRGTPSPTTRQSRTGTATRSRALALSSAPSPRRRSDRAAIAGTG
jgi:hypothetical protein